MKNILIAMVLVVTGGCASVPDPPGCDGAYRSLNPKQYTLQDTGHETEKTPGKAE